MPAPDREGRSRPVRGRAATWTARPRLADRRDGQDEADRVAGMQMPRQKVRARPRPARNHHAVARNGFGRALNDPDAFHPARQQFVRPDRQVDPAHDGFHAAGLVARHRPVQAAVDDDLVLGDGPVDAVDKAALAVGRLQVAQEAQRVK